MVKRDVLCELMFICMYRKGEYDKIGQVYVWNV